jgi:hypothetical protein
MSQVFAHYEDWEEWQAGMYRKTCDDPFTAIRNAQMILSSEFCVVHMMEAVRNYPTGAAVAFSDPSRAGRSWLGAAACCNSENVPEYITRIAWSRLTPFEQARANAHADIVIREWQVERAQTLFG